MNEGLVFCVFGVVFLLAALITIYPLRKNWKASGIAVCLLVFFAVCGYGHWGSFSLWQNYQTSLEEQKRAAAVLQSIKNPKDLRDKLEAQLEKHPESSKGWYLLGRLYAAKGDWPKAVNAYAKAYRLSPNEEKYAINYAEGLWQQNNQQWNGQIRDILNQVLKNNSNQPDALAMLAAESFMSHAYTDAIGYWQRLLPLVPVQSEEAQTLRKAIALAEQKRKEGSDND